MISAPSRAGGVKGLSGAALDAGEHDGKRRSDRRKAWATISGVELVGFFGRACSSSFLWRYSFIGNIVLHKSNLEESEVSIMPTPHRPSVAVRRALRKLGGDIRDARRRRGLPAEIVAERAFTSRPTLRRIEEGDHGVSIGIYAAVLQALGLLEGLGQLADPAADRQGLAIAADQLPQRIRLRTPKARSDE